MTCYTLDLRNVLGPSFFFFLRFFFHLLLLALPFAGVLGSAVSETEHVEARGELDCVTCTDEAHRRYLASSFDFVCAPSDSSTRFRVTLAAKSSERSRENIEQHIVVQSTAEGAHIAKLT